MWSDYHNVFWAVSLPPYIARHPLFKKYNSPALVTVMRSYVNLHIKVYLRYIVIVVNGFGTGKKPLLPQQVNQHNGFIVDMPRSDLG